MHFRLSCGIAMRKARPASIGANLARAAGRTVAALKRRKLTLATAESCTAGLVGAALSLGDGASDVLEGGFITYTKDQKHVALGVRRGLMQKKGCVNAGCVAAMTDGALKRSKADMAVAVSGVLGPKPDEDGNPVGLVYFCVQRRGRKPLASYKAFGFAPHDELRAKTVLHALRLVRHEAERAGT
jgi:nicotinamide-nucleotide amidase